MAKSDVFKASSLFTGGCNCSQAVVVAFGERFGVDAKAAKSLARAFGGGVARQGGICGAINGALMVLGFLERDNPDEASAKNRTYARVLEFQRRFEEKYGTLNCRDLIDTDISTPEGHAEAEASGVFKTVCPSIVAKAADILNDMLEDEDTTL